MPSARPLPTVIGPTENALRALLTSTLSGTAIGTYHAWVVLNAASRADPAAPADPHRAWIGRVADALKIEVAAAGRVVAGLRSQGLLDDDDALTDRGTAELAAARSAVARATARLTAGIGEAEQETTRAVLDRVRANAEALLREAHRAAGAAVGDGPGR